MCDKERKPTEEDIQHFIGKQATRDWVELTSFLGSNYDFDFEIIFYGKKYGWTVRYRKGGKTFCTLFPESGCFTVLIVLGKKEVEKVENILDELGSGLKEIFATTDQLQDGKWLWIRIPSSATITDIKRLLEVKRKPRSAKL